MSAPGRRLIANPLAQEEVGRLHELVDGFVAGIWRVENGPVVLEPFSALPRSVRRELEDDAGRLEAFLAD